MAHGEENVKKREDDPPFYPIRSFILLLATGFGAGFSPVIPGTVGTLVAVPIYYYVSSISSPLYELTLVAFFFFSSWVSNQAERSWGKRDDRRIVIDEIVGYLFTMLWLPSSMLTVMAGFLLFRLFDILKPFPIRRLERIPHGFGVVLDDVLAGIFANILLHLIHVVILSPSGRGLG